MQTAQLMQLERTERGAAVARAPARAPELAVYGDLDAVESVWRGFQRHADCTAFQTYEWLSAWQRHIGARNGVIPCVLVARDASGAILCILPLATRPAGFARELVFLGTELCDYNAPLLTPDFSARVDAAEFAGLWRRALELLQAQPRLRFDVIRLEKMPAAVRTQHNPMLLLPTTPHPSGCYATPLAPSWEAFYAAKRSSSTRRRDRTKRNRLAEFGEVKFITPATPAGSLEALSVLIEQKSVFFAQRGIANLFARPGYLEFFRDLASSPQSADLVHVSELKVGPQIVAANLGLTFGGRYYYVLSSYTDGELARLGPGAVHLHELMRYAIEKQLTIFDFTVGDEPYKLAWCDGACPLYDHVAVATWRGGLIAAPALTFKKLKRKIKQTPLLWAAFSKARAFAAALTARRQPAQAQPAGAGEEAP